MVQMQNLTNMGEESRPLLRESTNSEPLLMPPIYDSLGARASYEESGIVYVITTRRST